MGEGPTRSAPEHGFCISLNHHDVVFFRLGYDFTEPISARAFCVVAVRFFGEFETVPAGVSLMASPRPVVRDFDLFFGGLFWFSGELTFWALFEPDLSHLAEEHCDDSGGVYHHSVLFF